MTEEQASQVLPAASSQLTAFTKIAKGLGPGFPGPVRTSLRDLEIG